LFDCEYFPAILNKMKALKLFLSAIAFFLLSSANAQVSVNVNIGSPPPWGPVGYSEVRFYYLPDIEVYYDIQTAMFIYYDGGIWVHRAYLPTPYRNYDLYGGYKVVLTDYRGDAPYVHFADHRVKYKKGYRGSPQKTFGEKPGRGNSKVKTNPGNNSGNNNVRKSSGNGRGHGGGRGKGK
jgi:hypothetical protein